MRIHYLQHVSFENPGYLFIYFRQKHHTLSSTHFFEESYQLPEVNDIDALVIMGGSMGADEALAYPWLTVEKLFIKKCIEAGKKVLGICLGAQLMARCLNAAVKPAPHKEIGWYKIIPTEECHKIEWLYNLFQDCPVVFHWHGDRLELPVGSKGNLFNSEANSHQILYYNERVMGLQFHLEITEESLNLMLAHTAGDLTTGRYIQNKQTILDGKKYINQCNRLMDQLLRHWLEA